MKKPIALATVMIVLLTLTAITPVVQAATFTWDGLTFQEGPSVAYPHPDRTIYSISPYSEWSMDGWKLHHHQYDRAVSLVLIRSVAVLTTAFGAYVGARISGIHGTVVGAVLGAALGIVIYYVSESLFLDEHNCIWWWFSTKLIDQLSAWAPIIAYYSIYNPTWAQNLVLNLLDEYGYVRVGQVTFVDKVNPTWCQGDLNNDGTVNIYDIMIVSLAYGSSEGDPNWNPIADINEDGKVNIHDMRIVSRDFGKSSPIWPLPI